MTIEWGAWEYSGGNGMRVGIEYSVTSPSNTSSSCTFTFDIYTANQYNYNDSGQKLSYAGNISGSTTYNNTQGSGTQTQRATKTYVYTYSTWGSSPGKATATANLSGTYNGVTPSQTISHTIPTRPYDNPDPPTNVNSTRQSDAGATVTWTNHSTAGKPYDDFTIQMRSYTGSTWSGWSTIATSTNGALNTYVKNGLSANTEYQFQVQASNSAGGSGYATSDYCYMTPGAPSNAVAAISGANVVLTWVNGSYVSSTMSHNIERSVNGGSWTVMTTVPQGTLTWTDTAPGVGSNQYRVRTSTNQGPLYSAYTNSNLVTTVTPPLVPTSLSPNGVPVDLSKDQTFTWKHNPGADGLAQQAFQLRFSNDGDKTWYYTTPVVFSPTSSYLLPANTVPSGGTWSWQVATRGDPTAGFGPWSASANMSLPPYKFEQWNGSTLSGRDLDGLWDGTKIQPFIISSVETVK